MNTSSNKLNHILQLCTMALTAVLIALFLFALLLVGRLQGTARVVNYAGLVRGKTQRIVKLEIVGEPEDGMLDDVASYIDGLRSGSSDLDLVRLNDEPFQTEMTVLSVEFDDLRDEILQVRKLGYASTDIIQKSEDFFQTCDEATGLAEKYSQRLATTLEVLEKIVLVDILGLVFLFGYQLFLSVQYAAMNRVLQTKVYLDEATGLANKNKCEELLNAEVRPDSGTAICVFDMNDLHTINNTLGHDKGDEYIRSFARLLRQTIPSQHFVGRDGGDEFLAILYDVNRESALAVMRAIQKQAAERSKQQPEMPLSYAAGCALAADFEGCTMRELFRRADQNMYLDKTRVKQEEGKDIRNVREEN